MKRQLLISALAATLLLTGCVVAPTPYYDGPVIVEPPPPRIEYPGYPPVTGYFWIDGYWSWTGHRHEWVRGRWEPPRHGHRWVAPRWEREGSRWRQHPGRWERGADSRPRHPGFDGAPPPPRRERREERRPEPGPDHRPEQGSVPPGSQGEMDSPALHPVFTGKMPLRDKGEAGRGKPRAPRESREAPAPRVEQNEHRHGKQRDDRRSGRRDKDEER